MHDVNLYKSIRNMADVTVLPVADSTPWRVLHPRRLLMTTAALDALRASRSAAGRDCDQDVAAAGRERVTSP